MEKVKLYIYFAHLSLMASGFCTSKEDIVPSSLSYSGIGDCATYIVGMQ